MYQYSVFLYGVIGVLLKVVSKGKINVIYFSVHHPMLSSEGISCLEKCQVDGPGTGSSPFIYKHLLQQQNKSLLHADP